MRKKRMVSKVIFDAVIDGVEYKDIELDFSDDPVSEEYLHEEDGPWCSADVGVKAYDFQVWDNPVCESGEFVPSGRLTISACEMYLDVVWHHGRFVDIDSDNIRLEYTN